MLLLIGNYISQGAFIYANKLFFRTNIQTKSNADDDNSQEPATYFRHYCNYL